jgi:cobalt-zinc-cadmium efflux system outer membrane protein
MNPMKASVRFQKNGSISATFYFSTLICCALWVTCTQWSAAQAALEETGLETTLSLEQSVENALAQNPSILAVMESAAFAEGEVESARERPNPTFATEFHTAGFSGSRYRDFLFSLEQEWETAGKRKYRTLVAEDHTERAQYQIANARRLLIAEVKLAYLDVLRLQSLQRICQESAELSEGFLQFNEMLTQEGEIPPINVAMIRLELDGIANERLLYETRLKTSKALLAQLMGVPLDFSFQVDSTLSQTPTVLPSQEELLRSSLAHRPDLKFLETELKAAQHQLSLETARSKPNVIIGADLYKQTDEFETGFTAIGFHVRIPIPVFDRNHGGIMRATATRSSLREQVASTRGIIQKEVLIEIENYTLAALKSKLNSERIVRTQQTAGVFHDGYVLGAAAITDVLGLQRSVFELKKENILVEIERNSAWVRLQASIGENSIEDLVNVNGQVTQ